MQRILVVDDDVALSEMLQLVLRADGFDAVWCSSGTRAMETFMQYKPDLVLLDLMLPGRDGVDVCRDIRAVSGVPIVMLTAKSDTRDVVAGLEAGADDYVAKPFKVRELLARIRTRLRRHVPAESTGQLTIGDVVINVPEHTVRRGHELITLTPLEFDLLHALARRPRHAFTREMLLQEVWGYHHPSDTRLVNVHIQRLRSKIEHDPEHPEIIITLRGVGYRAGDAREDT
ncbi:MAG: response regulator transcription factor [Micropruina sp.]|nr:response regulator transcription factor [Micropruina sp.]